MPKKSSTTRPSKVLSFSQTLRQKRIRNGKRPINKLPPELLLRIFLTGDQEQRSKRSERLPYYGFQDLVTRVCSHWRTVAISNPVLWTYIYISRPPPHDIASVYITRSGSTAPLDIDLEMRTSFLEEDLELDDWAAHTERARRTVAFLVLHGASISRWRSLIVCAKTPQVLYKTIEFITPLAAPALRFLSLEWKSRSNILTIEDEDESLAYSAILDQSSSVFISRFPQLRSAEFVTLPARFLLRRPLPLLMGLTSLKLTPKWHQPSLAQLHKVLSSNLELKSLHISAGFSDESSLGSTQLRVYLPALTSLSVFARVYLPWALEVLKMIDAPSLEHLQISAHSPQKSVLSQLVQHITTCTSEDSSAIDSQVSAEDSVPSHKPAYSMIRHLDISSCCCTTGCTEIFKELLSALPTVTYLAAPNEALMALGDAPWLLPRLNRVRVAPLPLAGLVDVFHRRAEGGFPVETLEVLPEDQTHIVGSWSKPPTLVIHPSPVRVMLPDSDDEDEDDEDYDEDYYSDYDDQYGYDFDDFGGDYWPNSMQEELIMQSLYGHFLTGNGYGDGHSEGEDIYGLDEGSYDGYDNSYDID